MTSESLPLPPRLLDDVRDILRQTRGQACAAINAAMVDAYWRIGRRIVEEEQGGAARAEYGRQLIRHLARALGDEFGKGLSVANLKNFRQFYLTFPDAGKSYALRSQLSWTHWRLIMRVDDPQARDYYIKETARQQWRSRVLERAIETRAFQRLLQKPEPAAPATPAPAPNPLHFPKDLCIHEFPGLPEQPTEREMLDRTLAALRPLARAVWNLLVQMAAAPVSRQFWEPIEDAIRADRELTAGERTLLEDDFEEELPFERARIELADAGLLSRSDAGDFIPARHHALGRELVAPEERPRLYRQLIRVLEEALPCGNPHDDLTTWPFYQAAEQHLFAALAPERTGEIVPMHETDWLTHRFGSYLIQQSKLAEAQAMKGLNLENTIAVDGRDSVDHATSLHELARVHLEQGRHAEAEAGFQKALEIYLKHHGKHHPRVATARHSLAHAHLEQGRFAEAEAGFQKALEIDLKHHGKNHPRVAATLHQLASVHLAQGRFAEAGNGFQKALEIDVKHDGESHPSVATARNSLARTHLEQERFAEAEAGFQKALEIDLKHHGESHPSVATARHNLARAHLEQGRFAKAEAGFQKALEIYVKHHGEKSGEAAIVHSNLARVFWATSRQPEAQALFETALTTMESALGDEHLRVAALVFRWAECEMGEVPGGNEANNDLTNAKARLQRALALQERKLGAHHPDTNQTRMFLAECLRREGDLGQARATARSAAEILRGILPPEHRRVHQAEALLALLGEP